MSKYKAIILAAGQGTRLQPLTNDRPKCMVEVGGKPILNRQIEVLKAVGIDEIIVVTGYLEEEIKNSGIVKIYNKKYSSTNMVYSLLCAEKYLNNDVIISYGDIIYSKNILKNLMNNRKDVVVASDEEWLAYWQERFDEPLSDAESFKKGKHRKVLSLGQQVTSVNDIDGQFIGLVKLSGKGCTQLKETYHICQKNKECSENAWESGRTLENTYMTDILNFIAQKGDLHFMPIERGWYEVDDTKDLKIASSALAQ